MSVSAPKFRRESAEHRREAMIRAALELVAEHGVQAATVRAIADRANVTPGLIRHYFSGKEELIVAAYRHHMQQQYELSLATQPDGSAIARLRALILASLSQPVANQEAVTLWAGFINMLRDDDRMQATHEESYVQFREVLEQLIADALIEAKRPASSPDLRQMAIASNAVIDGLWMEGGMLPSAFEPGEIGEIGLSSVGKIVGINLSDTEDTP